jgi:putative flavoprotein involved in K+ transport
VIVATGAYSSPRVPDFAASLNPAIRQLHSSVYRRPDDLPSGPVLVVGFGTSGVEIASDLATSGRKVLISGRPTPQILAKFVPKIFSSRKIVLRLLAKLYWNFIHKVLTIDTRLGRKAKAQMAHRGQPLIRINQRHVLSLGIEQVPGVCGVIDGRPCLDCGRILDVSTVVWCTGFRSNYEFIDLPGLRFDENGRPIAPHGIVKEISGLYFLGIPFQFGLTSSFVGGVGRDAAMIARHILNKEGKNPRPSTRNDAVPVLEMRS